MKLTMVPARYRLRVKQRLAVIEYALAHGIQPTSRQFGLDRKTIRRWRNTYQQAGIEGLVPRYPARRAPRLSSEVLVERLWKTVKYEEVYLSGGGKIGLTGVGGGP
ncbi:MAG: helix-turn-helix domain-containing protein [Candidatus Methylomirabilota bacterium]